MYPPVMKFCLLLKFLGDGQHAKYQVHLGDKDIEFEVEYGQLAIMGEVDCFTDGFPIRYERLPPLPPERMRICEQLIYSGIASTIPKLLRVCGHGTVWFTHALPYPDYVLAPLIHQSDSCTQFHKESPAKLAIRD